MKRKEEEERGGEGEEGRINVKTDLHGTIFVAYNFLMTRLRHFLGHDCPKVLKYVLKSYDFFFVSVSVS